METFWFFWLRFRRAYDSAYDSDFWFSPGHKRSYDSAYDSDSDSVANENQPLMTVIFISSQHFTKATKVPQKGKGMVERVNQWRQMQTMKYDACVLKTDVQKKF